MECGRHDLNICWDCFGLRVRLFTSGIYLSLSNSKGVGYSQPDEVVDALETIGHEFKQQVFSSFERIFPGIVIVPGLLRRQGLILVALEKYFTVVRGTSSGR